MKKVVLGIMTCTSMILGTKAVLGSSQANIGYAIASNVTTNGYACAAIEAGASAGTGYGVAWAGAKIGGRVGAALGGPWGLIGGAIVGAV
jgi:hypothetical protein